MIYEYKVVKYQQWGTAPGREWGEESGLRWEAATSMQQVLNQLGGQGWEVASSHGDNNDVVVTLRRAKDEVLTQG